MKQDSMVMPATMIPGFRTWKAVERGVEKNILITTWGGIGDQICAEPTVRFALENFKDVEISLATHIPELFRHLKFKEVFDLDKVTPNFENYLVFKTIAEQQDLSWQFINHNITNCVDFPSLSAFRCTLPISYKRVQTFTEPIPLPEDTRIVIHPGAHWDSKTFPKQWWDDLITYLVGLQFKPIIVGKRMDDNRGTVDVQTEGCVDLRDKLDLNGFAYLCKVADVVLTNDSSPLHLAAAGRAFIGYLATCKHPDYLTHWREGQWGWRMKNLSRGGLWNDLDIVPNKEKEVTIDKCTPEQMWAWLPDPLDVAEWAVFAAREIEDERKAMRETLN